MGMFDSVYASCQICDTQIEFQSKAGKCLLDKYSTVTGVPVEIALSLSGAMKPAAIVGPKYIFITTMKYQKSANASKE